MTIRITVEDTATGDTETTELTDDVLVIVEGSAHVTNVQNYPKSKTQVWTVKGVGGAA
ncbi:hypothetical protein [Nocardioides sp. AX2bis]|uniref:hypothetical protein n=1 Tax=Nocardioides sp. AX2bis TaxID=2653157 RepID=UPI0012F2DDBC|nr:hypothetical protein [Nocardioides sp. AX2bis]VXB33833.1 conserved hypothetical protein [Nocardioides sp. AX2bis]